jgi:tetratricopeptide (TPR) repeat protein
LARFQGDYGRAIEQIKAGLEVFQELGNERGIAIALVTLGDALRMQGDLAQSTALYRESITIRQEIGERQAVTDCFEGLAAIAYTQGNLARSAKLLGAAEVLREKSQIPMPPADRVNHERVVMALRTQLDEATFNSAWAEGRAISLEQAMAYALKEAQ